MGIEVGAGSLGAAVADGIAVGSDVAPEGGVVAGAGDMDGDHHTDFLARTTSGQLKVYRGDGMAESVGVPTHVIVHEVVAMSGVHTARLSLKDWTRPCI